MPLTTRDFDTIVGKLKMKERPGKHRFVFFEHDGKVVVRTHRSNGRGELGSVEHAIKRQLHVDSKQMRDLADCPMTRDAYIVHLKAKGVIARG